MVAKAQFSRVECVQGLFLCNCLNVFVMEFKRCKLLFHFVHLIKIFQKKMLKKYFVPFFNKES